MVAFFSLLYLSSNDMGAQTALSEITGAVKDQSGAAVPGVSITLTNMSTGIKTALLTNEAGLYYTRSLTPGTYQIEAELPGFKTYRATGIELRTGQVLRQDIGLEVGEVTQHVQVVGEVGAAEIQKDSGDISTVINQQTVSAMPVISRKTLEMVQITPGVTMQSKAISFVFNTSFFSIAGNPGARGNMYVVDGTSAHFPRVQGDGGNVPAFNLSPEQVQEMRVITNNYSAEFGEGMGGVVMVTTKSGTNSFIGQLYYYGQNNALNAKSFFGAKPPPTRFHNYGGVLGGPIVKDKTHFFAAIEGERWLQYTPFILTLPTLKQRQGDFSETFDARGNLIPIYDPATTKVDPTTGKLIRDPFPGNKIPANRFDPVAAEVVKFYPDPNQPGTITGANNFNANRQDWDEKRLSIHFRIDHELTEKDKLYGRWRDETADLPWGGPYRGTRGETADPWAESFDWHQTDRAFGWTRTISPTTLSDFRFVWTNNPVKRDPLGYYPQVKNQNWAGKLGLKNLSIANFPTFLLNGYAGVGAGTAFGEPNGYSLFRVFDFHETISHVLGKHSLRVGGSYKHSRGIYFGATFPSGRSVYDTRGTGLPLVAGTGNSVASFLLGEVASALAGSAPAPDVRTWFASVFFQDDWRVTQNLTLNLGVRYEYDRPKVDVKETFNLFNFTKINPVCNCPGVIEFTENIWKLSGGPTAKHTPLYNDMKLMLAPRFGFAWSPWGRRDLVVRGGYGMFYTGLDYGDSFWAVPQAGTALSGTWNAADDGSNPAFKLSQGFPVIPIELKTDAFGAVPIGQAPRFAPSFYWKDRAAGYSQQMNFSLQKRFGANLLEVGYLGNLSRRLPQNLQYNEVRPELRGPGNAQIRRPFPQFGNVNGSGESGASSNYHAALIQFKRHFASGLSVQTNYTYSRHLAHPLSPPFSLYERNADYGHSALERTHRFISAPVYELPWGPGKRWLSSGSVSNILGGWVLGSIVNIQSGQWLTATNLFNTCNCFGRNQGVDSVGDPKAGVDHSKFDPARNTWFNTTAFAFPKSFTYGNARAPFMKAPGLINIDLTASKRFKVRETVTAEIRGDFFNLPNHPNFNPPNTILGSPSFGRISSALPGRIIQVGLKFFLGPY
jgi:hypothetical protein